MVSRVLASSFALFPLLFSCQGPGKECPSHRDAALGVNLAIIEIPDSTGPVTGVAAIGPDSVFYVGIGGRSVFLRRPWGVKEIHHRWGSRILAVGEASGAVVVATSEVVYRIGQGGVSSLSVSPPIRPPRRVWDLVCDANHLWVVLEEHGLFTLWLYRWEETELEYRLTREWALDGPSTISAMESAGIILSRQDPPFTLALVDEETGQSLIPLPAAGELPPNSGQGNKAGVTLVSTLALGCGRILQVYSELDAPKRWLVVRESGTGELIRSSVVDAALGFVQAVSEESVLIGAIETPGGRDLLLGSWKWEEEESSERGETR